MYNRALATNILGLLDKQYPRTLRLDEIKEALPGFSASDHEEWVLTIFALHQDGLVSAELVFADQSYEPIDIINARITDAGRKQRPSTVANIVATSAESVGELPNRETMLTDVSSLLNSGGLLSVLFIDLDGFKSVNDNLGHQQGDKCLESVVKVTSKAILGKGKIYRYGGDEFVVSLPNFVLGEALATSERIRDAIERLNPSKGIRVTASIGVMCSDQAQVAKAEELIDAADRAMYCAKDGGGNRVSTVTVAGEVKRLLVRGASARDAARQQVETVDLSMALRQAVPGNYILAFNNESDEEVAVKKLTIERNGLQLSQPATPKDAAEWTLSPRCRREISWSPSPDPVVTLQMSQAQPTTPVDVEIVASCQILGVRKVFRRKILVTADYTNRRLDPLSSW